MDVFDLRHFPSGVSRHSRAGVGRRGWFRAGIFMTNGDLRSSRSPGGLRLVCMCGVFGSFRLVVSFGVS